MKSVTASANAAGRALGLILLALLACSKERGSGARAAGSAPSAPEGSVPVPASLIRSGKHVRLFELTRDLRPGATDAGALPIFGGAVGARSKRATIYLASLLSPLAVMGVPNSIFVFDADGEVPEAKLLFAGAEPTDRIGGGRAGAIVAKATLIVPDALPLVEARRVPPPNVTWFHPKEYVVESSGRWFAVGAVPRGLTRLELRDWTYTGQPRTLTYRTPQGERTWTFAGHERLSLFRDQNGDLFPSRQDLRRCGQDFVEVGGQCRGQEPASVKFLAYRWANQLPGLPAGKPVRPPKGKQFLVAAVVLEGKDGGQMEIGADGIAVDLNDEKLPCVGAGSFDGPFNFAPKGISAEHGPVRGGLVFLAPKGIRHARGGLYFSGGTWAPFP
jgi:hypothetical protein